jgi:hypothetical protein
MIGFTTPETPLCSRAGCTTTAHYEIRWRNPKIHTDDRHKIWLACNDHREFLYEFLTARNFPVEVMEFSPHNGNTNPQ